LIGRRVSEETSKHHVWKTLIHINEVEHMEAEASEVFTEDGNFFSGDNLILLTEDFVAIWHTVRRMA
jgi:hypothetical protein